MTEAQIKHMVDRFLMWSFPENISPDGGFSFKRTKPHPDSDIVYPMPVGTNLLDAQQAEAMVRHMIGDLPADAVLWEQICNARTERDFYRKKLSRVRQILDDFPHARND